MGEIVEGFKDRLIEAMRLKNFNAAMLARQIGCPQATLASYLKGHIGKSIRVFWSIARALDVSTDWLLTGQDRPQDSTGQKAVELDKLMTEAEFRTLCIKVLRMEQKIEDLEAQVRIPSSRHTGGNAGKREEEEPETP